MSTVAGDGVPLSLDEPLPRASFLSLLESRGMQPEWALEDLPATVELPTATTVLSMRFEHGVVMAGDRRATAGNLIAHKRIKKVFPADRYSAVAISGTAGMALELITLFQTELEHYEKVEGTRLTIEGKANYLARMVRGNLALAFQGLAVVPLFCGYDTREETGRLYTFDVVGGRYEEHEYAATGSGGSEARAFLKGTFRSELSEEEALRLGVEALVAAAEEDASTGGPDLRRGILPNVVTVTADGYVEIEDDRLASIASEVMENRP